MNILFAMASINPAKGGPSNAIRALALELKNMGHQITIICTADDGTAKDSFSEGFRILEFPLTNQFWEKSRQYGTWVKENISNFDFVLVTSLFRYHTFLVPRQAKKNAVPFAIRPHGSLNKLDLAENLLFKSVYLKTVERRSLKYAEFLFCTSASEALEAELWTNAPIKVIPLGVKNELMEMERSVDRNRILFLGRIAKKKGLEILIHAQKELISRGMKTHLEVAGSASDLPQSRVENLVSELGLRDSVTFAGHLEESPKEQALSRAGVFVLVSLDENFGISVAEALATGIPVVISEGVSHAQKVIEYKAGLVVERNPKEVADAIQKIVSLADGDYQEMSDSAKALVRDSYSWRTTAEDFISAVTQSRKSERR